MYHLNIKTSNKFLLYIFLLCNLIYPNLTRNVGPQVDPGKNEDKNSFLVWALFMVNFWLTIKCCWKISGVFVITHIDSCRNGAGYCILGYSCEVDKDFTKDDLGGHCNGLSKAFNPRASFVCCRENPKNKDANKSPTTLQHIIDAGYSENQNHVYRYVRSAILEKSNAN